MIPVLDVFMTVGGEKVPVGRCRFNLRRGRIGCSFSYDDAYLASPKAFAIDPFLPLRNSVHHCDGLPGAMRDSSPDRWGRHLISRRRAEQARANGAVAWTLDEVDYLVGVCDTARQGALRYGAPGVDGMLSEQGNVPPLVDLKRLVAASNSIARGDAAVDQVKQLLDAGSGSLGGARPKATVVDDGRLLLAKFSHPGDEWDVMAWEKTALDIASSAGVAVPRSKLIRLGKDSALVLERFDRDKSLFGGDRIPYLSGMSLLGASDGEHRDYAELAESMEALLADPKEQEKDLFRRVVVSVVLHNTDDHLRNIGFVRLAPGWRLSPAFDINPNPDASRSRVTSIYGEVGRAEAAALKDLAAVCGIDMGEASAIVKNVLASVSCWKIAAQRNGCRDSELRMFAPVFEKGMRALSAAFSV
ncbi:MAG: type II toxin-antitoxin system HipA family toxin [Slackia sp.]|nr:type II toxin-antitoxin system HipA family toxin [Slackia sp.]